MDHKIYNLVLRLNYKPINLLFARMNMISIGNRINAIYIYSCSTMYAVVQPIYTGVQPIYTVVQPIYTVVQPIYTVVQPIMQLSNQYT